MTLIHDPALYQLRHALRGQLYEPGQPEYEDACTLFNAMVETRPRHVARCSHPHQVSAALAFARARHLRVAVRGGGHSVAGLSLVEDGLVIDVRELDEIVVDPERRIARIGGGATWAQVDRATQEHGLAAVGGRVSTTGVAGLTLGGGSGWLERKHGLACDNLVAVELITASGEPVRASADEHPELFWALRGGGGNFGVVTALELRLHEVGPEILGGLVLYPRSQAHETLRRFRDVMLDAPEELSLAYVFLTAPDEDGIPAELRGKPAVAIAGMHAGALADAEAALAPIREDAALDAFEVTTYAEFQCSIDDPPGYRNWWTAEYLEQMPDEAVDAMVAHAETLPAGPAQIFIPAWGGAVTRGAEGPLTGRGARFVVHPLLLWEDAADDAPTIAHGRRWREILAPYRTGATYLNFAGEEGADRVRAAYGPHYERLARVKAGWDPDNVFRATGNVRPTD